MRRLPLPAAWQAVVIADVEDPASWFDEIPEFKLARRREDWMRARIAGKLLARELGAAPPWISYSHSAPYAGAATTGIDVQVIRPMSDAAAHLYLTDAEHASAKSCAVDDALLHWWCAKEAAWKQQRGVIPTLKGVALALRDQRGDGLEFERVETIRIGDVIVALSR